jgi:molybdenum cofactor cytidylyltransferase
MISVVVLAARRSRQPAEQNAPAPLTDKPVLQWILENVLVADVDEVICVADDLAAARREIKLTDRRLIWHLNTAARRGQSTAVITGLWASHPESDGVMFVAAEPPLVPKELINALLDRFVKSPASIITARTRDRPPNPILFRRDLYPELLELTGDDSGLSLLERHIEKTALVEWPEEYLANMAERQTYASFKERV